MNPIFTGIVVAIACLGVLAIAAEVIIEIITRRSP
jgi:hypothetical protein